VLLDDEVVGPVTVLEAEMEEVVNVPLLETVEPPVPVTVENEELGVEVLVVVEHEVVVVTLVVTVVVVAEPEEVVVDAEAEEVELTVELAEVGVQPGRVNVPL
jgi:hypothetical protein